MLKVFLIYKNIGALIRIFLHILLIRIIIKNTKLLICFCFIFFILLYFCFFKSFVSFLVISIFAIIIYWYLVCYIYLLFLLVLSLNNLIEFLYFLLFMLLLFLIFCFEKSVSTKAINNNGIVSYLNSILRCSNAKASAS